VNRLSIALLALLVCAPLALADDEPPPPRQPPTETASSLITIDLNEVPLVMALQRIAEMAKLNVVVDASIASDPATRDVDVSTKAKDMPARALLRQLASTHGLYYGEPTAGVIIIGPAAKRTLPDTTVVVQIHAVSDLCKDVQAAKELAAELRRVVPTATIKPQGHGALVVRATLGDQAQIADNLAKMRQFAAAKARNDDPRTVRLRFFDVKDLVKKYDKLPTRLKRLFPDLQSADQKNGVLIVRGTNAQLQRVGEDLDQLRRTIPRDFGGPGHGRLLPPPPPPPSGAPVPPPPSSVEGRFDLGVEVERSKKLLPPTEEEWERAAQGPRTLGQRIESLRAEVRALRDEVRQLRALLQPK
jgi:type II secretory pathway component GspD/PulD (secretin)